MVTAILATLIAHYGIQITGWVFVLPVFLDLAIITRISGASNK